MPQIEHNLYARALILLWLSLSFMIPAMGYGEDSKGEPTFNQTTQARLAVEQAWETYHHAALAGTLASPQIQTVLEKNLHKSRTLLAEAYDAEDRNDTKRVEMLIHQIKQITHAVITQSLESKK